MADEEEKILEFWCILERVLAQVIVKAEVEVEEGEKDVMHPSWEATESIGWDEGIFVLTVGKVAAIVEKDKNGVNEVEDSATTGRVEKGNSSGQEV